MLPRFAALLLLLHYQPEAVQLGFGLGVFQLGRAPLALAGRAGRGQQRVATLALDFDGGGGRRRRCRHPLLVVLMACDGSVAGELFGLDRRRHLKRETEEEALSKKV